MHKGRYNQIRTGLSHLVVSHNDVKCSSFYVRNYPCCRLPKGWMEKLHEARTQRRASYLGCTVYISQYKIKPFQTEFIPVTVPRPKQSTAAYTFDHALHSRARINNHNEEIRYREIFTAQFFRHFHVSIIRGVKMMTFGSESSACFSWPLFSFPVIIRDVLYFVWDNVTLQYSNPIYLSDICWQCDQPGRVTTG